LRIDWIIACRYVEVHDRLGTIIGAGIDTLWVPELPATLRVGIAIRLVAMPDEVQPGVKHVVVNRIRDPQATEIGQGTLELELSGEPQPDWLTGVIVPAAVTFEAAEEGTFTIEFEIDGIATALPISVIHGPPPGAAG
jgi:hypothetical protein